MSLREARNTVNDKAESITKKKYPVMHRLWTHHKVKIQWLVGVGVRGFRSARLSKNFV